MMCDFDRPAAIRVRLVRARLPHGCISCGFPIMPSEVYRHVSGVWNGRGDDYRRHELCAVLEDMMEGDDGCGVPFGALAEAQNHNDTTLVFRRAWAVVMRQEWSDCEDCGDTLLSPRATPLCDECSSAPA